jgi:hypothetical protein
MWLSQSFMEAKEKTNEGEKKNWQNEKLPVIRICGQTYVAKVSVQDLNKVVNSLQSKKLVVAAVHTHHKVQACISEDLHTSSNEHKVCG